MSDPSSSRFRTVLVAALLAAGTFALFSRSLGYGFVNYDDTRFLLDNPFVQEGFTWKALHWVLAGHTEMWNPLTRFTQLLDWTLFGDNAWGHHLHSLLWHSLNAAVAFLLLRRLTGTFWLSAFGAALFVWHPLRVESVSWVSERKDVLSVAFGLFTLLAYVLYVEKRTTRSAAAARFYVFSLLAYVAALLSKPSMVALPGLLLLLDFWPLQRLTGSNTATPASPDGSRSVSAGEKASMRDILLEKIPFVLFAAIDAALSVFTQIGSGTVTLEVPWMARLCNAVVSIPRYLGKFFWPFDLSVAYPHPIWWPVWVVLAATLLTAAISYAAWRRRRTMPWIFVGWLWFLLSLGPMIGIIQVGFQSMADRYTYFPILGWEIALLWTLRQLIFRRLSAGVATGLAALVLAGAAIRTWDQQKYWSDSAWLYTHAIAVTENNVIAHKFLGYTYSRMGRTDEARVECDKALAIEPSNSDVLQIRAEINCMTGRIDQAIADYRVVSALKPNDNDKAYALANALLQARRLEEAETIFREILRRMPAYSQAKLGLAIVELARNHPEVARAILTDALSQDPANVALLEQLAVLLHQNGRDDEAARHFECALALAQGSPSAELLRAHATFLYAAGKPAAAFAEFDRAIAREPRNATLRYKLALHLNDAGRFDEALASYATAFKLAPTMGIAACDAAMIHLRRSEGAQAVELLHQAVSAQPDLVPANLALAQLAEQSGNPVEADACFARALKADETNPEIHNLLAETLAKRKCFNEAAVHYRRASELAPGSAVYHAGFGYMLVLLGRSAEAIPEWETALRLDPDFPNLKEGLQKLRAAPH